MTITKTYKFKLKLTPSQVNYIDRCIAICRFLYNLAKETKEWAYKSYGINLNYYDLAKQLTELKKQEEWLKEVPSQTLQDVLERLDRSFKNFFSGRASYPKWAKKWKYNSVTFKSVKIDTYNRVILPKIGSVKYFASQQIDGKLQRATITKEADGYYINIVTKQEIVTPTRLVSENQAIGIDMGVAYFLTTSDGEHIENPQFLKSSLRKLRIEQRSLARKVKLSNNWYKQKEKVTKLHLKIKRRRNDFLHKVSTRLVNENDLIVVEDLRLKNMTKSAKGNEEKHGKNVRQKSGLNRSMLDLGVGIFFNQLEYKAKWQGKQFAKVNPAYSSQECSNCGHTFKENRKTQSQFQCVKCGHTANADHNAAKVIRGRGTSSVTQRKAVA